MINDYNLKVKYYKNIENTLLRFIPSYMTTSGAKTLSSIPGGVNFGYELFKINSGLIGFVSLVLIVE